MHLGVYGSMTRKSDWIRQSIGKVLEEGWKTVL
jgi:hypothetical protein